MENILSFNGIEDVWNRRNHSLICKVCESGFIKYTQTDCVTKFYCAFVLKKFNVATQIYTKHQSEIKYAFFENYEANYNQLLSKVISKDCTSFILSYFIQSQHYSFMGIFIFLF